MNALKNIIIFSCLCLFHLEVNGDKMHGFYKPPKDRKETTPKGIDIDKYYWDAVGKAELRDALNVVQNNNVAKNVIIFLGDGMGLPTVTAARIYDGQNKGERGEENFLAFDKFPHVALSKTYNVNYQVSDSAGTGTAYLTGVKTNKGVIGFDARVERGRCETITNDSLVYSIAKRSQDKGKRIGVVTSTRITHATPANIYAHTPERDWECDTFIPEESYKNCPFMKDIARQLVEDEPGKSLNVIMGGGYQELDRSATSLPGDPVVEDDCIRTDDKKLWQQWLDDRQAAGKTAQFVRNKTTLNEVDLNNTEYLMGIFANSHIPYEHEKIELNLDLPTLSEMTEAAIRVLSQEPKGFFLLVEGGQIDTSHHNGRARTALDETVAFNEAILKAMKLTNEKDTLIIVTADHSHTMTINGYPKRGNSITGFADSGDDALPYTTLSYADGPGYNYTVVDGEVSRYNLTSTNTSAWDYMQQSAVPLTWESHGGEDVAIYATGPMAHLFHSVHEQNYIAHVMAYASCVDLIGGHCQKSSENNIS